MHDDISQIIHDAYVAGARWMEREADVCACEDKHLITPDHQEILGAADVYTAARIKVMGCAIHMCTEPAPVQPVLTGRFAMCSYGDHGKVPSNVALAFFEHHATWKHDRYYCGCLG